MKLLKVNMFFLFLLAVTTVRSQMIGIGTNVPTEKLDVNGKIKTEALILNSGGSPYDYLVKGTASGEVSFKKAMGGSGLNYIICTQGPLPAVGGAPQTTAFRGEIKLFAGNFAPAGWALCDGQLISIASNTGLFAILGTTYGGNGQSNFALPDLQAATIVGTGTAAAGYQWLLGEEHY
ncbi:MAG TPA: tail fiber protein [Chitinophagaceae bacterium]|nr:tail fiber protein [Chitinophagaceae bacterium]